MDLVMIGLGRMGAGMARRLQRGGHRVVAHDADARAVAALEAEGFAGAPTVAQAVAALPEGPRVVWIMVPAGAVTEQVLEAVVPCLAPGDVVVDGGNSRFTDTLRRAERLAAQGLALVDCGTSGGVWGLEEGYSLMVGGAEAAVALVRPLLETLAPAPDRGWGHVGPPGSGHFVKMVHNGIEYGMMQAYAEGFALLRRRDDFGLDLHQVAEIWRHGSVVRSWLLDLAARALAADPALEAVAPFVADSGEGRWTVFEAIDQDLAAPVITLALLQRLRSRDAEGFGDRLLAALRNQFGGHAVRRAGDAPPNDAPPSGAPPSGAPPNDIPAQGA